MITIIKKIIPAILLTVLIFYVIFPVALPLFGFSFIFTSGLLGLLLYAYNGYPFGEIIPLLLFFAVLIAWAWFCGFIGAVSDDFAFLYTKSQIAWVFSAYLIIYLFFKVHPNGGVHLLIYYILAALTIQNIIAVWMFFDPAVADFFDSIAMSNGLSEGKRGATEGKRLLGYGVAFFGGGLLCGLGLILIVYVFMRRNWNMIQQILWAVLYIATFLIGMLFARTALVGLLASVAYILILYFRVDGRKRSQTFSLFFYGALLLSIGVGLVYQFFPEVADWAFEPFIEYSQKGEFRTESSGGISEMFLLPTTPMQWIFGIGVGSYWGSDVGFTRLLFWFGIPGMLLFFTYQYKMMKLAFSGDNLFNLMLVVIFVYNLALNIKGLSDLNHFLSIFMMYFLYYRYFVYTPYMYRLGKVKQTTLRDAVQSPSPGRRV